MKDPIEYLRKLHRRARTHLAMLTAALTRQDRKCSSDDIIADVNATYVESGPWVGSAVKELGKSGIIVRIGQEKSDRVSRHGAEVKLWRVVDDAAAQRKVESLRTWLAHNPLPPGDEDDAEGMVVPPMPSPKKPSPMGATIGPETGGND